MSVATIDSAHITGLEAKSVAVEVDVSSGLYNFSIVGLPDKAVDESKDRVIAALKNSGLKNPKTENHKVTVSLSPAHIKKEGSHFDLPIALSYLVASKQVKIERDAGWFLGELSLSGDILPTNGILAIVELAKKRGITALYVPYENRREAALVDGVTIYACKTLRDVVSHFGVTLEGQTIYSEMKKEEKNNEEGVPVETLVDFSNIKGQESAKRALLIAAVGGHNIALYGPPGTGKTMLAKAFTSILPKLEEQDALEVTKIHSITGKRVSLISYPPYRSPHHTSSYVSIVGGGTNPRPGEVTLAHKGVLFLDEFPEFDKKVIESLREPLEEGHITVSRAKGTYSFPASVTLVASMNPCPCGYYGTTVKRCTCAPSDIQRYARKLSGPIVDRIDMWVPVQHLDYETLSEKGTGETSMLLREKVNSGRRFAKTRGGTGNNKSLLNKDLKGEDLEKVSNLTEGSKDLLKKLATKFTLSPRSYYRVLRLARTIADSRHSEEVEDQDILEAFQYRPKLYQDIL